MASNTEIPNASLYSILAKTTGSSEVSFVSVDVTTALLRFVARALGVVETLNAMNEADTALRSCGPWLGIPLLDTEDLEGAPAFDDEADIWKMPVMTESELLYLTEREYSNGSVHFGLEVKADSVVSFGYDYGDVEFTSANLLPLLTPALPS